MDDDGAPPRTLGRRHVVGTLAVFAVLVGGIVALALAQGADGEESPAPVVRTSAAPRQGRQGATPPVVEGGEHGGEPQPTLPFPKPSDELITLSPVPRTEQPGTPTPVTPAPGQPGTPAPGQPGTPAPG